MPYSYVSRPPLRTLALVAIGLALLAGPVLAPPEVPDDRVEFYVEADWGNYSDQEAIEYNDMTAAERSVFDTARSNRPETINLTPDEAPPSLDPGPDSIAVYNVRYDSEWYLLQARHLTYEADFLTQLLPRFGAIALGIALLVGAAYRRYAVTGDEPVE